MGSGGSQEEPGPALSRRGNHRRFRVVPLSARGRAAEVLPRGHRVARERCGS